MKNTTLRRLIALVCALLCVSLLLCACTTETPTPNDQDNTQNDDQNNNQNNNNNNDQNNDQNNNQNNDQNNNQNQNDGKTEYKVTVIDETGALVAGAYVQLCVGEECKIPVASDANGVATLREEAAAYTIKVNYDGYVLAESAFPAGATEVTVQIFPEPGTQKNPAVLNKLTTNEIEIRKNRTLYYTVEGGSLTMTVQGGDVSVVYNGETYTSVNGTLTIAIAPVADGEANPVFAITNTGTAKTTYTVSFTAAQ